MEVLGFAVHQRFDLIEDKASTRRGVDQIRWPRCEGACAYSSCLGLLPTLYEVTTFIRGEHLEAFDVVCITVDSCDDYWEAAISQDPLTQSASQSFTSTHPQSVNPSWTFLGFDIADAYLLSWGREPFLDSNQQVGSSVDDILLDEHLARFLLKRMNESFAEEQFLYGLYLVDFR